MSAPDKSRTVGWIVTTHYCRTCAPEGIRDFQPPTTEAEDYGVPFYCDVCCEPMLPCDHEWNEWRPAFRGFNNDAPYHEIRFCTKIDCGEAEYR